MAGTDDASLPLASADVDEDEEMDEFGWAWVLAGLPANTPILSALTHIELARVLAQCGPHPEPGTPGCDRGLEPVAPGPSADAEPPQIETAGSQFAPEPSSPASVVQAAANAARNLITSGLARTGLPDFTFVVLVLILLFGLGLGLRRLGRSPTRSS